MYVGTVEMVSAPTERYIAGIIRTVVRVQDGTVQYEGATLLNHRVCWLHLYK